MSRIIYDWVSICFKLHTVPEVIELLGLGKLNFQEIRGAHGYQDRVYSDFISIHYNGREDMGVWLEMSGKGCRIFETFGNGDYNTLLGMCLEPQCEMHLTRLDVAYDDMDGLLNIDTLCDDARQGNVVTRFHESSWMVVYSGGGNSVSFGSKSSEIYVRIYDKDAEQGHEEGRHWIRVELQLRRDRAEGFVKALQHNSIGDVFAGVLTNYVRFVVPNNEDTNKRRWETTDYWQALICNASAISLFTKVESEYTYGQLEAFVIKQAGNAIAAFIQIAGDEGFKRALQRRSTGQNPKYTELVKKLGASQQ